MSWKWLITGVLLVSFPSIGAAVDPLDECEANLVNPTGDRYFGAVQVMLKSGTLQDSHLQQMIESSEPINPLRNAAGKTHLIRARNLLASLAADAEVRALWPNTRAHIERLYAQRQRASGIQVEAQRDTAVLLGPRPAFDLASERFALTGLEDGRAAVAAIEKGEVVVRLLDDGQKIYSRALPFTGPKAFWQVTWHRDREGTLWIYLGGKTGEDQDKPAQFFRANMVDGSLVPLTTKIEETNGSPHSMTSLSPDFLLVETPYLGGYRTYNIAANPPQSMKLQRYWHDRVAISPDGKLLEAEEIKNGYNKSFVTRSGKVISVQEQRGLTVHGFTTEPLKLKGPWAFWRINKADLIELDNGRCLLAISQSRGSEKHQVSIYDLGHDENPIVDKYYDGVILEGLHWFLDRNEHPLLGFSYHSLSWNQMIVLEPDSKSAVLELGLPSPIGGWIHDQSNTYFWVRTGGIARIYRVFNATREGH